MGPNNAKSNQHHAVADHAILVEFLVAGIPLLKFAVEFCVDMTDGVGLLW